MRPQSPIKIDIKDKIIGGPRSLICLPLMAADHATLVDQARAATALDPDLIEWRVDAFTPLSQPDAVKDALAALHTTCRGLPLLFTCRSPLEGGGQQLSPEDRLALYRMAISSGQADLIDIELSSGDEMVQTLRRLCRRAGVKLMLSYHNFEGTPDGETLLRLFREAEKAGADIAKIAVMPQESLDVLTLLTAACKARRHYLKIPLVAISMGREGAVSRVAGGLFGSDMTFASGAATSAPGQLPIEDLKKIWSVLPWHGEGSP